MIPESIIRHFSKKNILVCLFCLFFLLSFGLTSNASVEGPGSQNTGIFLMNNSNENVRIWLGHQSPNNIKDYLQPGKDKLQFVSLKYKEKDVDNNPFYEDTILVNAVLHSDAEPYPSLVSRRFSVRGYLADIGFSYTNGNIEMHVKDLKPAPAPTPQAPSVENPDDSGVRFSGLNGQVEISPAKNPEAWRLAKMNTVICVGDHIRTDEDSSCVLAWVDMSTWVMKAESEIIILSAKGDQKIQRGSVWTNLKKILESGSMDIEMNQAVTSIKGTTLICEQLPDGTSVLKVLEGIVEFKSHKTGMTVVVKEGQTVSADTTGLRPAESFDKGSEAAYWEELRNTTIEASSSGDKTLPQTKKTVLIIAGAILLLTLISLVFIFRKR